MKKSLCCVLLSNVLSCIPQVYAATFYKVVDPQTGQTTYTNNPSNHDLTHNEVSQVTVTDGPSNYNGQSTPNYGYSSNNTYSTPSTSTQTQSTALQTQQAVRRYRVEILNPSEERAYLKPTQSIDIKVDVSPRLREGDTLEIKLNDETIASEATASVTTTDVELGEHQLTANVLSVDGDVKGSDTQTIYVIQNTLIARQKRAQAARIAEYQALPMYKKMIYGVMPNNPYQDVINLIKSQK